MTDAKTACLAYHGGDHDRIYCTWDGAADTAKRCVSCLPYMAPQMLSSSELRECERVPERQRERERERERERSRRPMRNDCGLPYMTSKVLEF